ncbi:transposable element Tcb2 transposase [Trichonephila clavipes]|nr:transposable element Tcb2 transposase [Trichonephila clavipes]
MRMQISGTKRQKRRTAVRKVGGGRPWTTTAGDERYIILQAKRGRLQSASVIAQQLSTATGRQVSRFTVARRLRKGGLFVRRPERCLPLGSVIGDRHCEEVLLPHVRRFRGAIGSDFIFMDDNTRPHRTLAVEELLESEDITRMDWPAYSLDLNPIKHV